MIRVKGRELEQTSLIKLPAGTLGLNIDETCSSQSVIASGSLIGRTDVQFIERIYLVFVGNIVFDRSFSRVNEARMVFAQCNTRTRQFNTSFIQRFIQHLKQTWKFFYAAKTIQCRFCILIYNSISVRLKIAFSYAPGHL